MRNTIVKRDKLRRNIFNSEERKRRFCKVIQQNLKIEKNIRTHFTLNMSLNCRKDSSATKIRNRCIITGRGRSIYRDFRLSRMQLRHLASFGYLMGIKKSSW